MSNSAPYPCRFTVPPQTDRDRALATLLTLMLLGGAASTPAAGEARPAGDVVSAWLSEPAITHVRLAPDGNRLAWLAGNRLHVAELASPSEPRVLRLGERLTSLRWAGDDGLVVRVLDGRRERLVHVDADRFVERHALASASMSTRQRLATLGVRGGKLYFTSDVRSPFEPDLYRVSLPSATPELVERNPGRVIRWHVDRLGRPVAAESWQPAQSGVRYNLLAGRAGRWHAARSFTLSEAHERVLQVADGRWLLARQGAGEATLGWFDPLAGRLDAPVWRHADGRITNVVDALPGPQPGLVAFEADRPRLDPVADGWATRVAAMNSVDGRAAFTLVGRAGGDETLLWKAEWTDRPGSFYVQRAGLEAEAIFAERQGFPEVSGISREPFEAQARDGLALPGFVTRPRANGPRPAIALVHGGPWARDDWGFDPAAHFLATLGYAVIQVNFRGSTGQGNAHLLAGRQSWGGAMQDDLLDALEHAEAQGWAVPGQACVMGASYGGYAALMGVLRDSERFRCAVSLAPVTDLVTHVEALRASGNRRGYLEWREMVGPDRVLATVSPMSFTRLERPVLLGYGTADRVVAPAQARRFAARFPGQVRSVPLRAAGHDLHSPAARRIWYASVASFLAEHLPPPQR